MWSLHEALALQYLKGLLKITDQVARCLKPDIEPNDPAAEIPIGSCQAGVDHGEAIHAAPTHADLENLQCIDEIYDLAGWYTLAESEGENAG